MRDLKESSDTGLSPPSTALETIAPATAWTFPFDHGLDLLSSPSISISATARTGKLTGHAYASNGSLAPKLGGGPRDIALVQTERDSRRSGTRQNLAKRRRVHPLSSLNRYLFPSSARSLSSRSSQCGCFNGRKLHCVCRRRCLHPYRKSISALSPARLMSRCHK